MNAHQRRIKRRADARVDRWRQVVGRAVAEVYVKSIERSIERFGFDRPYGESSREYTEGPKYVKVWA